MFSSICKTCNTKHIVTMNARVTLMCIDYITLKKYKFGDLSARKRQYLSTHYLDRANMTIWKRDRPNFGEMIWSQRVPGFQGRLRSNCHHGAKTWDLLNATLIFLDCDWFKKLPFSTNSLAKLLSDSLLLDSLLLDSLLSDSSISQSRSKLQPRSQGLSSSRRETLV